MNTTFFTATKKRLPRSFRFMALLLLISSLHAAQEQPIKETESCMATISRYKKELLLLVGLVALGSTLALRRKSPKAAAPTPEKSNKEYLEEIDFFKDGSGNPPLKLFGLSTVDAENRSSEEALNLMTAFATNLTSPTKIHRIPTFTGLSPTSAKEAIAAADILATKAEKPSDEQKKSILQGISELNDYINTYPLEKNDILPIINALTTIANKGNTP